jgi:hypothetical protein
MSFLTSYCVRRRDFRRRVPCGRAEYVLGVSAGNGWMSGLRSAGGNCGSRSVYGWGRRDGVRRIINHSVRWKGAPNGLIVRVYSSGASHGVPAGNEAFCFVNDNGAAGQGVGFYLVADSDY